MEKYYLGKNISNFKGVVVTSVSRGGPSVRISDNNLEEMRLSAEAISTYSVAPESVMVTHDVVLAIPNNANSEEVYNDDFAAVAEAAGKLFNCKEVSDCPYNAITPPNANKTEENIKSVCDSTVKDPDLAEYYEPVRVEGSIKCVTMCDSQHSDHKKCYNKGECKVYRSIGALCECQNVQSTWYLSDDCSLPIHKTAFYAGLSATLACLLVTVGVLTACMLINKQKQTQSRDMKEKLVNQWLNEDFKWSRPQSPAYTNNAAIHTGESSDYRQPLPVYQMNRPPTYNNNRQPSSSAGMDSQPHNTSFFNDGYAQPAPSTLPLREFSSNQQFMINRIRTSWDV
ncbi:hypothetical protein E3U43_007655 [Larimichthys crocea]|uniref:Uncharacterized protein n=1 Tax=Larimichthys crocea TaxID=215358 RepID=A0ACD3Q4N6_LARCR|nr:hypothetical protein E3U43_007655 [Larimichthys crocea]